MLHPLKAACGTMHAAQAGTVLQKQQQHLMSSEDLGQMPLQDLPESVLCLHLPSSCLLPLQLAASFCQDMDQGMSILLAYRRAFLPFILPPVLSRLSLC